jgi:DNA-binding response OmpR family regulator
MAPRGEVLVCGCRPDDVEVLGGACREGGARVRVVQRPAEMAHRAVAHPPVAVVLGIGQRTRGHLELIPVIRAVRTELPILVIGEDDSLELERRARQAGIFYYFVHPLERPEVEAVLEDLLRRDRASTGRLPAESSLPGGTRDGDDA